MCNNVHDGQATSYIRKMAAVLETQRAHKVVDTVGPKALVGGKKFPKPDSRRGDLQHHVVRF